MIELKKQKKHDYFGTVTKEQAKDTGLAMVLICLLFAYFGQYTRLIPAAMLLLLVTMTVPGLFKPLAKLWFALSHLLGTVMSKVMLSLVFFLVLTPMAYLRRMAGKDPMKIKQFKASGDSVFRVRDHVFDAKDIEQPF